MAKSAIDAEINNQIFRKDYPMVIALRRDLAQISPVRLQYDANGYSAGQVLARVTSTGIFGKYSAVSGSANDSLCVLFENVESYTEGTQGVDAPTGGVLARAIMAGYVFQAKLIDYTGPSQLAGRQYTDASGIVIVKF